MVLRDMVGNQVTLTDNFGNILVIKEGKIISLRDVLVGRVLIGARIVSLSYSTRNVIIDEMKRFLLTKHCRKGSKVYTALAQKDLLSISIDPQYNNLVLYRGGIRYIEDRDYSDEIVELKKKLIKG